MRLNVLSVDAESTTTTADTSSGTSSDTSLETSSDSSADGETLSGLSSGFLHEVTCLILCSELKPGQFKGRRSFSEASQGARNVLKRRSPSNLVSGRDKVKVRMSMSLLSLLVYTVGVKCRGINKKEHYAPEHMFSLSERTANKMFKRDGVLDLIKHNRAHLVRVYPKSTRVSSTNFVPQQYWSAGVQLVALNWQTYGEFGSRSVISYSLTLE
jgi:phosphatidylinositol phospholipase C delta